MLATLVRILPPTIHPMIVHFPIALMFTAALFDAVGLFAKRETATQAGFALLTLGLLSLGAAGVAGWVSEHAVHLQDPAVRRLLEAHKRDAVLTTLIFGGVWLDRFLRGRHEGFRPRWFHLVAAAAGLAMLATTGALGGALVYEHGVGVAAAAVGVIVPS